MLRTLFRALCATLLAAQAANAQSPRLLSCDLDGPTVRIVDRASGATVNTAFTMLYFGGTIQSVNALARHPGTGQLWAVLNLVESPTVDRVVTVNEDTGFCNLITSHSLSWDAIAFSVAPVRLWGITAHDGPSPGSVWTLDLETILLTVYGSSPLNFQVSNGGQEIAYDFTQDRLYHMWGTGAQNVDEGLDSFLPLPPSGFNTETIQLGGDDANLISAMVYEPESKLFYIGSLEGSAARLYNMRTDGVIFEVGAMDHRPGGFVLPRALELDVLSGDRVTPLVRRLDNPSGATIGVEFTLSLPGQTIQGVTGMARHPGTGELWALAKVATGARILVTVDEDTGVCTSVGTMPDDYSGIAFTDHNGGGVALYGVTGNGAAVPHTLYEIDMTDASVTNLLTLPDGNFGSALGYDSDNGRLYYATGDGVPNSDELLRFINPQTLTQTPLLYGGYDAAEIRGMVFSAAMHAFIVSSRVTSNSDILGTISFDGHRDFPLAGITTTDHGAKALVLPRPANDDCWNAAPLTQGQYLFNMEGATNDGDSSCTSVDNDSADLWYSFTLPAQGTLTVSTCGSSDLPGAQEGVDTVLSLHTGCPGDATTQVTCNDQHAGACGGSGGTNDSFVQASGDVGDTILIRVSQYSNGFWDHSGPFLLQVSFVIENDDCVDALTVVPGTYVTSLQRATPDGISSCGSSTGNGDVWYRFTASEAGTLLVTTCGTHDDGGMDQGIDTVLTLFDGCGGAELACNNDANGFLAGVCSGADQGVLRDAVVGTLVNAGDTVLVRVSRYWNTGVIGRVFVNVSFEPTLADLCNGDGGDQMGCTPCPCSNDAPQGTVGGCLNQGGQSAQLIPDGSPSATATGAADLSFRMLRGNPLSLAVLTSGAAVAPTNPSSPCAGTGSGVQSAVLDGLRCAVQATQRHGGRSTDIFGHAGVINNGWGGANGPQPSLAAQGGFTSGQTRYFQVFYRADDTLSCMTGQNTTQAVRVIFTP